MVRGARVVSMWEFVQVFMDPSNTSPRILGVDFGSARTGLAVTVDRGCRVATSVGEVKVPPRKAYVRQACTLLRKVAALRWPRMSCQPRMPAASSQHTTTPRWRHR